MSFKSYRNAKTNIHNPNKKVSRAGSQYIIEDKEAVARYKLLKERGIITFNYDLRRKLTRAQEKRVLRYWQEFEPVINDTRLIQTINRKSPEYNKAVAALTGQNIRLKGARLVVPAYSNDKKKRAKVKFKDGKAHLEFMGHKIETFYFDQTRVMKDDKDYIKRATEGFIGDNIKGRYTIIAGDYEIRRDEAGANLPARIAQILNRYGSGGEGYEGRGVNEKNHFSKWLVGLRHIGGIAQANERRETVEAKNKENQKRFRRNKQRSFRKAKSAK